MIQPTGTQDQRTFIHNVFQNILDISDSMLKGLIYENGIDPNNIHEISKRVTRQGPPVSDPILGAYIIDGKKVMEVTKKENKLFVYTFKVFDNGES